MSQQAQVSAVIVPHDESQPLQSILIPKHPSNNGEDDLEQMTRALQQQPSPSFTDIVDMDDVRHKLLIRPDAHGGSGLRAYGVVPAAVNATTKKNHPLTEASAAGKHGPSSSVSFLLAQTTIKNVRATRLAMACGHFSYQLYGTCVLVRTTLTCREDLSLQDVYGVVSVPIYGLRYSKNFRIPPQQK